MRITKISVKDLFGIFDHEIPLNSKDHITIIHGPNGYGKTILLTLLNAIFKSEYHRILSVPFSKLSITFDNGNTMTLTRTDDREPDEKKKLTNGPSLKIEFFKLGSKKSKLFNIEPITADRLRFPIGIIDDLIPELKQVGSRAWRFRQTGEVLSLDEVLIRFGDEFRPYQSRGSKEKSKPVWLKGLIDSIRIQFIETQRLLDFSSTRHRINDLERISGLVPAVNTYSKELAKLIQSKLADYGSLSQSLDRTFPSRLVKGIGTNGLTLKKLKKELNELEEKRKRLMSAGFLDKEKEIDFKDLQQIDEENTNVLAVSIEEFKAKRSGCDELTEKIALLIKIVNSRFLHKELSISKTDGFVFTTAKGRELSPIKLSSGEQHELVLLYELLFKVSPESLILIDEPELSLHVVWQQQFLVDLQEITKLVGFDVLIATHSPQIISDRWDLTVELEGPKQ
ncbi:MAG: AAA family ATPase [bacterium]|nr:AAA family ATPase [bacterium]